MFDILFVCAGAPRLVKDDAYTTHQYLGRGISLDCIVAGNPLSNITWYRNNVILENEHGSFLNIRRLQSKHEGFYQCIVENSLGSDTKFMFLSLNTSGTYMLNVYYPDVFSLRESPINLHMVLHFSFPEQDRQQRSMFSYFVLS